MRNMIFLIIIFMVSCEGIKYKMSTGDIVKVKGTDEIGTIIKPLRSVRAYVVHLESGRYEFYEENLEIVKDKTE